MEGGRRSLQKVVSIVKTGGGEGVLSTAKGRDHREEVGIEKRKRERGEGVGGVGGKN